MLCSKREQQLKEKPLMSICKSPIAQILGITYLIVAITKNYRNVIFIYYYYYFRWMEPREGATIFKHGSNICNKENIH